MLQEYLSLGRYVKFPWRYFWLGLFFLFFYGLANGVSLSSVVPLMDRILSRTAITVPDSLPFFLKMHLEKFFHFLNSVPALTLLKALIVFIIAVIILKGLFYYFYNYYLQLFGARILTDIRYLLYQHLMFLPLNFFSSQKTGELTTRIVYDVNVLNSAFAVDFPHLFLKSMEAAVYLIIIFTINWKLSLVSLIGFPFLVWPVLKVSRKLRKLSRLIQENYAGLGQVIQQTVYGQPVIKAYGQEKNLLKRFHRQNEGIFQAGLAIIRRTIAIMPFTEIVAAVAASGLIFYGAKGVLTQQISAGFFFLFMAGLFSLISPVKTIGTSYASLKQASAALPRLIWLLKEKQQSPETGRRKFSGLAESIEFQHVFFSYDNVEILKDVSFTLKKGQSLGIVGPTGAGKTTLVGLLLRFYEPSSGQILIDGVDLREFTISSLRQSIGLVTQEPILFSESIAWNIALEENFDLVRVQKVAEAVGLSGLIESLPDGYHTVIGERGITLSGGQKQLVTVARALYRDPPVLILDEATASLDSESEQIIQKALERLMVERTVLVIAHRLSTLRHVNHIIVLKEGRVVEQGNHLELFDRKGVYYNLWSLQFLE